MLRGCFVSAECDKLGMLQGSQAEPDPVPMPQPVHGEEDLCCREADHKYRSSAWQISPGAGG